MAHFASIDVDNIVTNVVVINNDVIIDEQGQEQEALGVAFCQSLFGSDSRWVQTSYNGNLRRRYAGIGFKYDASYDAFIPPSPYPSWVLNSDTLDWDPPVPPPEDEPPVGSDYVWSEEQMTWELVSSPEG